MNGSYHKFVKGYNSHNGYYNLCEVVLGLIRFVENSYNIKLPTLNHWFVNRVDIALCFDLKDNISVIKYISNLRKCDFPRRENRYKDYKFGLYYDGKTTTLKIYNKYLEFLEHDFSKLKKTDFDVDTYLNVINGFIRFEVEIKKKKLVQLYKSKYKKEIKNIRVTNLNYNYLLEVWKCEFMKLLKMYESDLKIVRKKEDVEKRLKTLYSDVRARNLYNFYLSIIIDGKDCIKDRVSKSCFYRNTADLMSAGIDFSQKFDIDFEDNMVDFNPFEWKEVV